MEPVEPPVAGGVHPDPVELRVFSPLDTVLTTSLEAKGQNFWLTEAFGVGALEPVVAGGVHPVDPAVVTVELAVAVAKVPLPLAVVDPLPLELPPIEKAKAGATADNVSKRITLNTKPFFVDLFI